MRYFKLVPVGSYCFQVYLIEEDEITHFVPNVFEAELPEVLSDLRDSDYFYGEVSF